MLAEKKRELKARYLKPKTKLRQLRRMRDITTEQMAEAIGIERRQYQKKEAGEYAFNDYEMVIISRELGESIEAIFYAD
ncbi:helix-turn-helix domain-containing protein [Salinicoccus roseus]|uniref:helix-turn-helix transcriptional regulator n=1 Tax=Salinicoccus roseus TaxID=45670 RepID=UPI001CA66934|nr:helix-turn-helix domain-containing protein [Salinicoccus roseus]MBY8908180.1 helix-turn-helix domain-containing protein [Salinicoccus roseus]